MCFIFKTSSHIKYRKEAQERTESVVTDTVCSCGSTISQPPYLEHQRLEGGSPLKHPLGGDLPERILEYALCKPLTCVQTQIGIIYINTVVYVYMFCIIQ